MKETQIKMVEIPGFPGYSFNEKGELFKDGAPKKASFKRRGRMKSSPQVIIRVNNKCYSLGLARLIAEEFIPNPRRNKYIIFKDGNSHNCQINNIAWVDSEVYMYYCTKGKRKPKIVNDRLFAIDQATDEKMRNYYISLDEEWLQEAWKKIDNEFKIFEFWPEIAGEVYVYFLDRAKRFSILGKPEGILWYAAIGERAKLNKTISATLPLRLLLKTDESLRIISQKAADY